MAAELKVTDSQGTQFYICDTGVDLSDAAKIKTALAAAKRVAFIEEIGEFAKTRKTNEYECIDEDATAVSQGAISYSETELKLFYAAGQNNGMKTIYYSGQRRTYNWGDQNPNLHYGGIHKHENRRNRCKRRRGACTCSYQNNSPRRHHRG